VRLRVNATGCDATGTPLGTASLEYSTVLADEDVDFQPIFAPYGQWGLDGGGSFFGLDGFQFDSIVCGWDQAGVVSGGTDVMRVQVLLKQDAGVVCTCDLPGTCADAPSIEHTCTCSGGKKYLTDTNGLKYGYALQLDGATNCGINPRGLVCALPLHQ
jgi:hypothetical protein